MDYLAAWMFLALTILLMIGFPVTFTLLGTALTFGMIGFGWDFFNLLPLRVWGRMGNVTLAAVPLFVFMGVMLERSGLAEELLDTMGLLFGRLKGGLAGISVGGGGGASGRVNRYCGCHGRPMGLLARSHDVKTRLPEGTGNRDRIRLGHPGTNHPTEHRAGAYRGSSGFPWGRCLSEPSCRDCFWSVFLSSTFFSLPIFAPGLPRQFQKKN